MSPREALLSSVLYEALKATTAAINAAVQMGMAEAQGHERIAARLDGQIQAARALSRKALDLAEAQQEPQP